MVEKHPFAGLLTWSTRRDACMWFGTGESRIHIYRGIKQSLHRGSTVVVVVAGRVVLSAPVGSALCAFIARLESGKAEGANPRIGRLKLVHFSVLTFAAVEPWTAAISFSPHVIGKAQQRRKHGLESPHFAYKTSHCDHHVLWCSEVHLSAHLRPQLSAMVILSFCGGA